MDAEKTKKEQRETTSFGVKDGSRGQFSTACQNCKGNDDVQIHGLYQPVYFCAKCREKYPGAGDCILM